MFRDTTEREAKKAERERKQLRKRGGQLRSMLRTQPRAIHRGLPTGLQCCEGCNHRLGRCVVTEYVTSLLAPIQGEYDAITAQLAALDRPAALEGELLDQHGRPVLFALA